MTLTRTKRTERSFQSTTTKSTTTLCFVKLCWIMTILFCIVSMSWMIQILWKQQELQQQEQEQQQQFSLNNNTMILFNNEFSKMSTRLQLQQLQPKPRIVTLSLTSTSSIIKTTTGNGNGNGNGNINTKRHSIMGFEMPPTWINDDNGDDDDNKNYQRTNNKNIYNHDRTIINTTTTNTNDSKDSKHDDDDNDNDDKECQFSETDWQTKFYPTCNTVHELSVMSTTITSSSSTKTSSTRMINTDTDKVSLLSMYGTWRSAWLIEQQQLQTQQQDDNNNDNADTNIWMVLKMLQYTLPSPYTKTIYENHQRDVIFMQQLQSSPYIVTSYGFCGQSVLTEYAIRDGLFIRQKIKQYTNKLLLQQDEKELQQQQQQQDEQQLLPTLPLRPFSGTSIPNPISWKRRFLIARDLILGLVDIHNLGSVTTDTTSSTSTNNASTTSTSSITLNTNNRNTIPLAAHGDVKLVNAIFVHDGNHPNQQRQRQRQRQLPQRNIGIQKLHTKWNDFNFATLWKYKPTLTTSLPTTISSVCSVPSRSNDGIWRCPEELVFHENDNDNYDTTTNNDNNVSSKKRTTIRKKITAYDKCDIYMFGNVIVELLTGQEPWYYYNHHHKYDGNDNNNDNDTATIIANDEDDNNIHNGNVHDDNHDTNIDPIVTQTIQKEQHIRRLKIKYHNDNAAAEANNGVLLPPIPNAIRQLQWELPPSIPLSLLSLLQQQEGEDDNDNTIDKNNDKKKRQQQKQFKKYMESWTDYCFQIGVITAFFETLQSCFVVVSSTSHYHRHRPTAIQLALALNTTLDFLQFLTTTTTITTTTIDDNDNTNNGNTTTNTTKTNANIWIWDSNHPNNHHYHNDNHDHDHDHDYHYPIVLWTRNKQNPFRFTPTTITSATTLSLLFHDDNDNNDNGSNNNIDDLLHNDDTMKNMTHEIIHQIQHFFSSILV